MTTPYQVALVSLGCAKNLVDSERMLAILSKQGYGRTEKVEEADVIIINTCGFIESAKRESIDAIIAHADYKSWRCRALAVTGCLVQKYQKELETEIPEVDIWLGALNFTEIDRRLADFFQQPFLPQPGACGERILSTPSHWGYLKIAEGCNNHCSFCLIPQMRGPYLSKTREEIVAETRFLSGLGVREVNLLAQDTTAYGKDIYGEPALVPLLEDLVKEDVDWIRLLYSYPSRIDDRLLTFMAENEKICPYLDMPIQHSENQILQAMGRRERRRDLEALTAQARATVPGIAIRTTIIVGFPGEREDDFLALMDFLARMRYDWVGVFPYSREEDTPAALLPNQVPEEEKEARYHRLMALLNRLSAENMEKWVGSIISVLVEGKSGSENEYSYYGRANFQAPEVDGLVYFDGKGKAFVPGDMVRVKITGHEVYDLIGECHV